MLNELIKKIAEGLGYPIPEQYANRYMENVVLRDHDLLWNCIGEREERLYIIGDDECFDDNNGFYQWGIPADIDNPHIYKLYYDCDDIDLDCIDYSRPAYFKKMYTTEAIPFFEDTRLPH